MTTSHVSPELIRLTNRYCDDALEPGQFARLQTLVRQDANSRQVFCEVAGLHADLIWQRGPEHRTPEAHNPQLADAEPESVLFRPSIRDRFPVIGFLGSVSRHVPGGEFTIGVLIILVVIAAFWGLATQLFVPRSQNGDEFAVATISNAAGVRWSRENVAKDDRAPIHVNELLKIDSGRVELQLKRGAKLLIDGPARWSINGDNCATLHAGRIVANVPPAATGFWIDTHTARIVDLGTEFAVETGERGATKVWVLKGRVELRPEVKVSGPRSVGQLIDPIILKAGESRIVEPEGQDRLTVRQVPVEPNNISLFDADPIRQIPVEGTFASSTHPLPALNADNLIRDRGLTKGHHSAAADSGLHWHTDFGHVRGEFVLFDLGTPYRLTAMKVWNYNQPGMQWRGVKYADVYVSDEGFGDPLKNPGKWRRISAKQEFHPATGTSDYSQPDTIPLGDAAGRFVAIVIDEALGEADNVQESCVGLSEVQFLGLSVGKK